MRTLMTSSLVVAIAVASIACGPQAGSLQAANEHSVQLRRTRSNFRERDVGINFGQAPAANLPWSQFDVSNYTATINYATPAARAAGPTSTN